MSDVLKTANRLFEIRESVVATGRNAGRNAKNTGSQRRSQRGRNGQKQGRNAHFSGSQRVATYTLYTTYITASRLLARLASRFSYQLCQSVSRSTGIGSFRWVADAGDIERGSSTHTKILESESDNEKSSR